MYIIPGRYGISVGNYGLQEGQNTVIKGRGFHSLMKNRVRAITHAQPHLQGAGFHNVGSFKFEAKTPRFIQKARNNIRYQK